MFSISSEENIVSSRNGPREPQKGDTLEGTGPQGLPSDQRVFLCNPGGVALQHFWVPQLIQKCSGELNALKLAILSINSSVELEENSSISADPIGRVSQHCSQALDSRRTEDGRLHKKRTSEPAHAGRGNWMPRNNLNPSMSRCFKKSLQIL